MAARWAMGAAWGLEGEERGGEGGGRLAIINLRAGKADSGARGSLARGVYASAAAPFAVWGNKKVN